MTTEWVPATERLPDEMQRVLVYVHSKWSSPKIEFEGKELTKAKREMRILLK